MIAFLKRIPWWFWLGVLVAILFIWQSLSGWAMSRKLYSMALDTIREDQSQVVETLQENQKMYEEEIARLQSEKERLQKEKALVQAQAIASAEEVTRLKGKIGALQYQIDHIIISDNPDRILDDLHRLGILSIRRKP
jgi:peptidoglycan hydrolase CwlO-like protein